MNNPIHQRNNGDYRASNTAMNGYDNIDNKDPEGLPLSSAPINVSSSDCHLENQNIYQENVPLLPSDGEPPYNNHSETKDSSVPLAHRKSYEALHGDNVETTATSTRISESNPSSITTLSEQGSKKSSLEPFPIKLYQMLAIIEDLGFLNIISWRSHGRAFKVNDKNQFVKLILPKFFRQTKITSFQRQLNLYGFCRFLNGPDNGAYYHELFLREHFFLCKAIFRTKVKGKKSNKRRKAADLLGSEPNFYEMEKLPSLHLSHRKSRLRSFFTTEEHLARFITFLSSNAVARTQNQPENKRTTMEKDAQILNDSSVGAEFNILEDQQLSSNDDADDEEESISVMQHSFRKNVTSENKEESHFKSIDFGFHQNKISPARDRQIQQVENQHIRQNSFQPHQVDSPRESSAESLQLINDSITDPCPQSSILHLQTHYQLQKNYDVDLNPTPIHLIQQNGHFYFQMMLLDEDFKDFFRKLLKRKADFMF
eukprot:scaffold2455_cov212-Chaetoceros_neogracile.AAC.11